MKLRLSLACVVAGLALFTAGTGYKRGAAAQGVSASPRPADGKRTPVLVELFTSEGCSSCPPADALIARLEKSQPVAGAEVIALKEHVDYWNHLGWRDPYSSAEFSQRQNDYAQAFGSSQVYTPQMIVDGRTEFVGSSEGRARQAILQEARAPKAAVHLRWAPIPSGQARDLAAAKSAALGIPLDVRVEQLGETTTGDTPEVYLAITESNLHSEVLRGENAGSKFDHFAVVRELKPIGTANPQAATAFSAQQVVRLAPTWKRENLRAVVFVQERHSRRVLGAAALVFAAQ